jgi:adsorption protein B
VLFGFTPLEWAALVGYELSFFAGIFFLIGSVDDIAIDLVWLWLKFTRRAQTEVVDRAMLRDRPLSGRAAMMIPAWREAAVIGATISHALKAWPQDDLRIYVGCYRNDPDTVKAVVEAARGNPRVRLVVNGRDGPTSKADCLNRIYAALCEDERRCGIRAKVVLLHDAEDMVDPAALPVLDHALGHAEFVQLPVLPQVQPGSRWIGGHYCDEFAESHGKAMVVRQALGAGLPTAGVGCAFSRDALERVARQSGRPDGPFAPESLTEDYELGLKIGGLGGTSRFLRIRGQDGRLVATRAYFPGALNEAVRQKARWIHGIAFQGWERLGWDGSLIERWMRLRDRRGPLAGLVLAAAYLFFVVISLLWLTSLMGWIELPRPGGAFRVVMLVNVMSFLWRAAWRFAFTTHEYGVIEGLIGIMRIPFANVITIFAGRRALLAYLRSLNGQAPAWDKTEHLTHPALSGREGAGLQ